MLCWIPPVVAECLFSCVLRVVVSRLLSSPVVSVCVSSCCPAVYGLSRDVSSLLCLLSHRFRETCLTLVTVYCSMLPGSLRSRACCFPLAFSCCHPCLWSRRPVPFADCPGLMLLSGPVVSFSRFDISSCYLGSCSLSFAVVFCVLAVAVEIVGRV